MNNSLINSKDKASPKTLVIGTFLNTDEHWKHFSFLNTALFLRPQDFLSDESEGFENLSSRVALPESIEQIIGYSMGGRLALHLILQNPNRFKKAVIISSHTGLPEEAKIEREQRSDQDLSWANKFEFQPWVDTLAEWNQQGVFGSPYNNVANSVLPVDITLTEQSFDRPAIARCLTQFSLANQRDLLPRLKECSTAILWIAGEKDSKYVAIAKQSAENSPGSQVWIAPQVYHRVPWEVPGHLFSEKNISFLE